MSGMGIQPPKMSGVMVVTQPWEKEPPKEDTPTDAPETQPPTIDDDKE